MNGRDVTAILYESRLRLQAAAGRASLMSTLEAAPRPAALPPFRRRRVLPLEGDFIVRHSVATPAAGEELPKAA